jgi:hypothetical protein
MNLYDDNGAQGPFIGVKYELRWVKWLIHNPLVG